jgi:hypothetical protein
MPETYTLIDRQTSAQTPIIPDHWRLQSVDGLGMPDVVHVAEEYVGKDGEVHLSARLKKRFVNLKFQMVEDNEADLWDARYDLLEIVKVLAAGFYLRIAAPNGDTRQLDLRYSDGLSLVRDLGSNLAQQMAVLQCVAHDPLLYDPAPIAGGPFDQYDIGNDVDVTNPGSWHTYPVIVIHGPLGNVLVENRTSAETMELDLGTYVLAANDEVTIDLTPGYKTIVSTLNGNIIAYLTNDSNLATWRLLTAPVAPAGVNTIRVSGTGEGANTAFLLDYYARYIGM